MKTIKWHILLSAVSYRLSGEISTGIDLQSADSNSYDISRLT